MSFRQVIPRWRSPTDALTEVLQHRVASPAPPSQLAEHWLAEATQRHQSTPDLQSARELAEISTMMGSDSPLIVQHPRHELLADVAPSLNEALTEIDYSAPTAEEMASNIRRARENIRRYEQQPFAWAELARAHISMGHAKKAKRAMLAALGGAPRNSYLLRAAARFFTLLDKPEPDRALWLLRKHGALEKHPHLLSAEIAIASSENIPTKHARLAEEVLVDKRFSPQQLAELAAAVGTVEHQNGKHKRAKARFAQSLINPTENSLAQAYWASQQDSKIIIPDRAWDIPRPHEANAWSYRETHDYTSVVKECTAWIRDQPFEITPALLGSYYCTVPSLVSVAEAIATAGLIAHPRSVGLLNNRAVARIYMGDLTNGLTDIKRAVLEAPNDPHLIATLGLYAFRSGNIEEGRRAYLESALWFKDKRDLASPLLSILHWIREELRIGASIGAEALAELRPHVDKLARTPRGPDVKMIFDLVSQEAAAPAPIVQPLASLGAAFQLSELDQFKIAIGIPDGIRTAANHLSIATDHRRDQYPTLSNVRILLNDH